MKQYLPFIYRGYNSTCEIDIPQELMNDSIEKATMHHEEMFERFGGYENLFLEYKKKYNKDAIKDQTLFPEEYRKIQSEIQTAKEQAPINKVIEEPEPVIEYRLVKIQSYHNIWDMYEIYYSFNNLQFIPTIILNCDKTEEKIKERVLWQISFYSRRFDR